MSLEVLKLKYQGKTLYLRAEDVVGKVEEEVIGEAGGPQPLMISEGLYSNFVIFVLLDC